MCVFKIRLSTEKKKTNKLTISLSDSKKVRAYVWNFQERLITINICVRYLNFEKSRKVSSYKRKRVFAVLAHLKLEKCSNLIDSFFSCLYNKRLVSDCKRAYSNNLKPFKIGEKIAKKKKAFFKVLVGLS